MAAEDQSDDLLSRDTLRDILADLTDPPTPASQGPAASGPAWSFPHSRPTTTSNSPRQGPSPLPRTGSRPQQHRASSSSQILHMAGTEPPSQPALFTTPNRSIFSSGPPTASLSANTAQASLSPAASSASASRPLSALTSNPLPGSSRKSVPASADHSPPPQSKRRTMTALEKDVDDPSTATQSVQNTSNVATPTALTQLFATESAPGTLSRHASSFRTPTLSNSKALGDTSTLTGHLLHHGLLGGRHSDITVHAFGTQYRLHRLLLDRAPFFSTCLSGPWAESSAKEITLHPEEIDSNITRAAFELALKRIYGCGVQAEEEQEAVGLFATGCWLDMPDLVESSIEALLHQMHPSKLADMIRLVTSNYYGRAGDRILASSKAMLCSHGWEMPYEYWDGIPGDIVREIVGGDAFYVPGEWERWYLTVRLLNRRLKVKALEAGLIAPNGRYLQQKPSSIKFFAVRFDTVYRKNNVTAARHISERDDAWLSLYTSPEVAPLLVLLDEGIHYVHLRFEQLQQIRNQKDILGVPVMPEKVISNALWMSMELRQRIVNAQESELELGLTQVAEDYNEEDDWADSQPRASSKGKEPEGSAVEQEPMESDSWDGNGRPRKFWVPLTDSSCIIGGVTEALMAAMQAGIPNTTPHMSRLSASLEPSDVQWASDFMAAGAEHEAGASRSTKTESRRTRFCHYPPFRFSAEFPNPRTLKEKKRVYSQTVWYAGSMWNLYIQRVNTSKNQQLGIYLHRAKDKDPSDDPLAQLAHTTVDDRIGQLEREMLMRKSERRSRHWRSVIAASGVEIDPEDETSGSGGDHDTTLVQPESESSSAISSILSRSNALGNAHKTSQTPNTSTSTLPTYTPSPYLMDDEEEEDDLAKASRKFYNVSALPPYVDGRPTIRTYFKIYSPSKGGRLLSLYESAPDRFNFSQSWGWKSSNMVLDDGFAGVDSLGKGKDGRLRYMVTIGNV